MGRTASVPIAAVAVVATDALILQSGTDDGSGSEATIGDLRKCLRSGRARTRAEAAVALARLGSSASRKG